VLLLENKSSVHCHQRRIDRSGDIVLLINIIRGDRKNVNISELMLEDERDGGMS